MDTKKIMKFAGNVFGMALAIYVGVNAAQAFPIFKAKA